ncbi:uncharacterized protein LOC111880448 [Lactuca sativa]|uniref:Late embryogenesis abundant protein LEA-2 subgroup domain-containing protein n=1 Tax=Lactuca sativa TaxID=4236 RepID=A0A9R1X7N9_LACSA|nr:uncharacterized protein LOC111880448 [Lactuca sativa]KAJ0202461.1 hypothetical protein LSAT_V11C600325910 [Lactuca sativa]
MSYNFTIGTFNMLVAVVIIVLLCFYSYPNPPKLSIEEFSVPAFNYSSNHTAENIYFDLKLRNMNKAIGLYYEDPLSIAFFYYPYDDPYQKYVWAGTLAAFYQGNGKTKHIKSFMGNDLQLPSTVVVDPEEHIQDLVKTDHVRSLLKDHLQLPSTLAETRKEMVGRIQALNIRIAVVINYRFKYWVGSSKHQLELGGNVMVDLTTGEMVSPGSIDLVESAASAGGQVMLVLLFTAFLLIICF